MTQIDIRLDDLKARAVDVTTGPAVRRGVMSAREAAAALGGIAAWIARVDGVQALQGAAAALARHEAAWQTSLGNLPHENGYVAQNVALLAVVCRGLLDLAGPENLRAGLAFWASESDAAEWIAMMR